ncbi:DUF2530 domain-containing protein [Naasia aerilata]|uniref:DUF2530 domain-containing protein n=1 Tax=Naasia aerilata TaxID=1162966 RepID=A0ABN6XJ06_9MICO|nr:DUF2530 domain-containing protein [Naasia aerilata]BDZ44810.1 hypothetical protein GCM10025866_07190 [Naasia aerilata]
MRFYLKDSERRPDPAPVKTDDRAAVLVGLLLWVIALAVALITGGPAGVPLWSSVAGLGLGVALLIYVEQRRRRS